MPDGVGLPAWGGGQRVWEIMPPEEDLHQLLAASCRSGVKEGGVSLTCPSHTWLGHARPKLGVALWVLAGLHGYLWVLTAT